MYKYKIVKTEKEKEEVFLFLQSVYKKRGYFSDGGYDNSFGKYLSLPDSRIFTAFLNENLFGTVSVVVNSDMGLPMDVLNSKELEPLRMAGKKFAEVTQYAIDKEVMLIEDKDLNTLKQSMASLPLLNLVIHYALCLDLDYLVIATTPEHSTFYRSMGFVELAPKKYYPSVNTWGVAQMLDIKALKDNKNLPGILEKIMKDVPDYGIFK